MKTIAFSIKGLLAAVTLIAVGLFALLNASPLWVSIIVSLTVLLFLAALLALVCRPNPRREFWAGFAFFGWGYLVLAYMPLGQSYNLFDAALKTLHKSVSRQVEVDEAEFNRLPPRISNPGTIVLVPPDISNPGTILPPADPGLLPITLYATLPPKPSFYRIGHCLWAWLFAVIGGFLARHFYLAQERTRSAVTE